MTSQLQVLNKILQTRDFSIVTLNNLTEDQFFNYTAEFNYIKTHVETYNSVPDKLTFLAAFPDFDLQEVSEPDNYLVEQIFKDFNDSYLQRTFNTIKTLLESDKSGEAANYFVKAAEGFHTTNAMTCTNLFEDTSRYDRYVDRATNKKDYYISTGFKELDDIIGGIDCENENMVIAARTGVGKSWTLLIMAAAAAKQGKTVGIYSGEMSVDKVGTRIDTILGHISNMSINRGDLFVQKDYEKYIKGLKTANLGALKVITPNDIAGPATVDALKTFIEKEHLDILFVDQYSLLEDTSHAKQAYEKVANISKAIKNLQVMKQIPIISVSQMNRTKNEDDSQDTTQIAQADRIGQDATSIIMLNKKDDKLILNIVKARDGGDGHKLTYAANFNTGVFTFIPDEHSSAGSAEDLESSYEISDDTEGNPF